MWRQQNVGTDDNFYMLYPKAQCNLKDYMRRYRKVPTLNKQFVEHWILQLHNLADALEAIHSLRKRSGLVEDDPEHAGPSDIHTGSVRSSLQPPSAERKPQKAGYHHDLKPENILVFDDGTWKISDFGTAGLTQVIYGRGYLEANDIHPGDPIYSPPDLAMGKRTARSYDVWCFGCILLEILLTMFQNNTGDQLDEVQSAEPAPHRLDAFYAERANSVQGVAAAADFWYKKANGKPALRPPVEERISMLRRRTKDYDQFDALTELVQDMLDVEASKRPSAEKVSAGMRRIWRQVTRNLMMNENFYTVPGSLPQPYVSRPTTEGESQSSSPKTTDNFSNGVPSTQTRHLQPPEHRRVRRYSAPSPNHVLLDLGNDLSNGVDSSHETAVTGTPTTPIIQVHYPDPVNYADNISLGSHEDSDDPGRTPTLPSRGILSRNFQS
jgi:serine/threonine protein kinase